MHGRGHSRSDKSVAALPPNAAALRKPLPGLVALGIFLISQAWAVDTPPQAYSDQLIDESVVEDDTLFVGDGEEGDGGEGQRSLGVDYKYYSIDRNDTGTSLEQGVALRYRQETAAYGEFYLDSEIRTLNPAEGEILSAPRSGSRVTLYQNRLPVTEALLADNALGVIRGNSNSLVSSTFRRVLPSSLLVGVGSSIYDQDSEARFTLGSVGRLNGIASQQFNTSSGRLAGLGYTTRLSGVWSGGAQLWDLQGNDEIADHQSVALAGEYLTPTRDQRYQVHSLLDSQGNNGVWLDGENRINLWQHRYGIFRLEPGLLWNDVAIASDEQGVYWRADYLSARYSLSGGLETRETNIEDDPSVAGIRNTIGFVSGSRRISRLTNIGGLLSLSDTQPISGPPGGEESQTYNANVFLAHRFGFGLSRFQLARSQTFAETEPSHADGITWDHEWSGSQRYQLSTRLAYERENVDGDISRRLTSGVLLRGEFANNLRWDSSVTYGSVRGGSGVGPISDNSLSASLGASWAFRPQWEAQAQYILNRTDNDETLGDSKEENSLFLTLGYQDASGTPFPVQGRQVAGSFGNGSVTGRVFFDENGDGIRQPTEKNAARLAVFLDGRLPVVTDSEGIFQFNLVATGEHTISLAQEDLPLPWGLLDDAPRKVKVELRQTVDLDIPLVRLNQ